MTGTLRRRRKAACVAMLLFVAAAWVRLGPIPPALLQPEGGTSTLVVDRNGVPLYEARSADGTRGVALAPDALPPILVAATLAAEDRRFWWHPGVDPIAIARALARNVTNLSVVEGGSTISQQAAKLLLARRDPNRRRGVAAKINEAVLALRLEHRLRKPDILALYLNLAGYGNQIAGAERASRAYFGRSASMLTAAQAAFLAGLPQRPSTYNPYRNHEAARARQREVLDRMESAGSLTAAAAAEARDEHVSFAEAESIAAAPHFVAMVLGSVGDRRPARIETTLDAGLQGDVAGIIASHRALLDSHGAANVAVVVLDNAQGQWRAWEGSGDYFDATHGGAIDGARTPRQPGSALKPLTYALAFEQGYSPATVLADVPSHFATAEPGIVYSPRNYDGRYRGSMLARAALAGSENVPAVALASDLGVPALLRFCTRAGLTTFDRTASYYGLGLTLGNAEVRLDELVSAYSAFARGGEWVQPSYTQARPRARTRLVSERTAFWITDILSDAGAREYIFGRGGSLDFPFPVAVKTGTSQAYHDNWTIGYSRSVTVGVWVGNFDRTPLRNSSGVTGAAPIFHAVMLAAERRLGIARDGFAAAIVSAPTGPSGVEEHDICALSGLAANAWCPTRRREWLAADDDLPACNWHHLAPNGLVTLIPDQYVVQHERDIRAAERVGDLPVQRVQTAQHGDAPTLQDSGGVRIANPPDGATYLIDPTLRPEFQALAFRASSPAGGPIGWTVDGHRIGTVASGTLISWPLVRGRHRIEARDSRGRTAERVITVH